MALADSVILATDQGFTGRVLVAFIAQCVTIMAEPVTTAFHYNRTAFAARVMQNPSQFQTEFAQAIAADTNVIYAATYGLPGAPDTATLTAANVDGQAAQIQDSIIITSVSSNFNAFFPIP